MDALAYVLTSGWASGISVYATVLVNRSGRPHRRVRERAGGVPVLGGTTAFASHGTKASLRLAANTSPEPVSNIALSLSEDTTLVGILLLAIHHPWIAAAVALMLLVAGVVIGRS